MGQWVKVNAAMLDAWSSVPGTQMAEGQNQHPKVLLYPHTHCGDLKLLINLHTPLRC